MRRFPIACGLLFLSGAVSPTVAAPTLPPVTPQVIKAGKSGRRVVALTFDACWKTTPSHYDARIIEILRKTHTPATLLLGGRWMEAFPRETKQLGSDPLFELGNHSYIHPHMTQISEKAMRDEILKTQAIQFRLAGKQGKLFRPPYGEYNDKVAAVAAQCGLKTLLWSVETGDPDPKQSAKEILKDTLRQVRPGAVIIMHMNGRGWHSAEALPTLISSLRAKGYRFVKVSDL